MKGPDRRKNPRHDVETPLTALALSAGRPNASAQVVRVINLSFGGFLVESASGFEPGETYDFRFKTRSQTRPVVFKARAIYRVERTLTDPASAFACGFAFIDAEDPFTLWRIRELIEHVTSSFVPEPVRPEPTPRLV